MDNTRKTRQLAAHESGHFVAAMAYGLDPAAWIRKMSLEDVRNLDPARALQCEYVTGQTNYDLSYGIAGRVTAMAGAAANDLFDEPEHTDPWEVVEHVQFLWDFSPDAATGIGFAALSPADRAGIGTTDEGELLAAAEITLRLIRDNLDLWRWVADELLRRMDEGPALDSDDAEAWLRQNGRVFNYDATEIAQTQEM